MTIHNRNCANASLVLFISRRSLPPLRSRSSGIAEGILTDILRNVNGKIQAEKDKTLIEKRVCIDKCTNIEAKVSLCSNFIKESVNG